MSAAFVITNSAGETVLEYAPYDYQEAYHASEAPNLLALGTRNTGKSLMLRRDAMLRCLLFPNFRALILRRTMPELRKSQLIDVEMEMKILQDEGYGDYISSPGPLARFTNGSRLFFAHCETEADILSYLSGQYGFIGFDELSTFSLDQFLQISSCARAPKSAPYKAVVRAGSNPLGPGADWMEEWFVTKTVNLRDFPDYHPDDFETQFSSLEQNLSQDSEEYAKRLKNLPAHVRRAWLLGEFVNEGAYFADFHKVKDSEPWHVIDVLPTLDNKPLLDTTWINLFRCVDWGYDPDPAVCLWLAVLPNGRTFPFKEMTWKKTLADEVAADIKKASAGMRIVETFCDPTMLIKEGQTYSIGEIFEQNGVPLTAAKNDRELSGYSIHQYLNTIIDVKPQLQIVQGGCPNLIRTLPKLRMDPLNPTRIAAGEDHYAVALSYFCMGQAPPSRNPQSSTLPPWMRPKSRRNIACL